MIVQYKAELKGIEHGKAHVHVTQTMQGVFTPFLAMVFVAILRNMKDTNKRAFYEAMSQFAQEDFDDASEFLYGEQEHD